MIIFKLIPQILLRTQFICLFNNVKFNNEFNLLSGFLDYPRMQNTILASKCLQYKINNWQRVAGCRVIIGCRRRLKQSSSTADSLVISFGLNENHGLNPSKEIRKMWAHYWCPLTGWCVSSCLSFFQSSIRSKICWFTSAAQWSRHPLPPMSATSIVNALELLLKFLAACSCLWLKRGSWLYLQK